MVEQKAVHPVRPKPYGPYDVCPGCGEWKAKKAYMCRSCSPRIKEAAAARRHTGFVSASVHRARVRHMYESPSSCERCSSPSKSLDVLFKDENAENYTRENVSFVCRRCKMQLDGRLDALIARNKDLPPCRNCGRKHKASLGFRHGTCWACRSYWLRNSVSRPRDRVGEDGRLIVVIQPPKPCSECSKLEKNLRRGLCHACNERKRRRDKRAERLSISG